MAKQARMKALKDLERSASPDTLLTDAEKITLGVLIDKANQLQQELQRIQVALSGTINDIVVKRGLNPIKYGVNLAVGRILPVTQQGPPPPVKIPGGDGKEEKV